MNSPLNIHIASDHATGMLRDARRHAHAAPSARPARDEPEIRLATLADQPALNRLAELEGTVPLAGAVLVAALDGDVVAAIPLAGGSAHADPFRPTAAVVDLLAEARRDADSTPPRGGRRLGRARAALGRLSRPRRSVNRSRGTAPTVPGSESLLIP